MQQHIRWNRRALTTGLYALSAAAAALLIVEGPGYYSPRALRLAWDLGHVPAFFVWTATALSTIPRFSAKRLGNQRLIALIHEQEHNKTRRVYSDRFNGRFALHRSWNDIDIPLVRIRHAPVRRALNLRCVRELSIISVALPEPRVIYVDDARLDK